MERLGLVWAWLETCTSILGMPLLVGCHAIAAVLGQPVLLAYQHMSAAVGNEISLPHKAPVLHSSIDIYLECFMLHPPAACLSVCLAAGGGRGAAAQGPADVFRAAAQHQLGQPHLPPAAPQQQQQRGRPAGPHPDARPTQTGASGLKQGCLTGRSWAPLGLQAASVQPPAPLGSPLTLCV